MIHNCYDIFTLFCLTQYEVLYFHVTETQVCFKHAAAKPSIKILVNQSNLKAEIQRHLLVFLRMRLGTNPASKLTEFPFLSPKEILLDNNPSLFFHLERCLHETCGQCSKTAHS